LVAHYCKDNAFTKQKGRKTTAQPDAGNKVSTPALRQNKCQTNAIVFYAYLFLKLILKPKSEKQENI